MYETNLCSFNRSSTTDESLPESLDSPLFPRLIEWIIFLVIRSPRITEESNVHRRSVFVLGASLPHFLHGFLQSVFLELFQNRFRNLRNNSRIFLAMLFSCPVQNKDHSFRQRCTRIRYFAFLEYDFSPRPPDLRRLAEFSPRVRSNFPESFWKYRVIFGVYLLFFQMATSVRHAPISWAQRDDLIFLTVELDTVKIDELTITPTSFKFK